MSGKKEVNVKEKDSAMSQDDLDLSTLAEALEDSIWSKKVLKLVNSLNSFETGLFFFD